MEPETLVELSAKAAAQYLSSHKIKNFELAENMKKLKYQQEIGCHLKGRKLAEFVRRHHGLHEIKKSWNREVFQRFLLNFVREMENKKYHESTKTELTQQFESFSLKLCDDSAAKAFDSSTASLGFGFTCLVQYQNVKPDQNQFFATKFDENVINSNRFPIPRAPKSFKNLFPKTPNCNLFEENDYPTWQPQNERKKNRKKSKYDVRNCFFLLLTALTHVFNCQRDHEVLAYSFEILSNENFRESFFFQSFFHHVYGMLAVTFAKYGFGQSIIDSCLNQWNEKCLFVSEKLDRLHYKQQVFAALHQFENETAIFKLIMKLVPGSSMFYKQTIDVHINSQRKKIENIFMAKIIVKIRNGKMSVSDKTLLLLQNSNVNEIIKELVNLLNSVYEGIYGDKEEVEYFSFHNLYPILDLYQLAWDQLNSDKEIKGREVKISEIMESLEPCYYFLRHFLEFFSNPQMGISTYRSQMTDDLYWVNENCHAANVLPWANIVFSHFLMLKIFVKDSPEETEFRFAEALFLYRKFSNPRLALCEEYENAKLGVEHFKIDRPQTVVNSLEKFSLLDLDPRVKHLIVAGVQSVKRYDAYDEN